MCRFIEQQKLFLSIILPNKLIIVPQTVINYVILLSSKLIGRLDDKSTSNSHTYSHMVEAYDCKNIYSNHLDAII